MLSRIFPDTRPINRHRLRGAGRIRIQIAVASAAILIFLCIQSSGQRLVINEVLRQPTQPTDSSWIELFNSGTETLRLTDYTLQINSFETISLPDVEVGPLEFRIIHLHPNTLPAETILVSLLHRQEEKAVDEVNLVIDPFPGESVGRVPDGFGKFIIIPSRMITPGLPNASPGPWVKHANTTAFSPRDSSPNASVVHRDSVWVFAGYRHVAGTWFSESDVYKSADGQIWELVNSSPPFDPYSAFVSFRDTIRAFGTNSYYSVDGKDWVPFETSIPFTEGMRATVHGGAVWILTSTRICRSTDAVNWEVVTDAVPWGLRDWPAFLSFRDKLWVIGGGVDYLSGALITYNDVWSSDNGTEWQQVTPSAQWSPRYWFNAHVYDDKIWLFGGWQETGTDDSQWGNLNEIWVSSDGEEWVEMFAHAPWPERHALFSFTFRDRLWISAGYGHGGVTRLYNDVWSFGGNTFFARSNSDLSTLDGWSSTPDGNGNSPESFSRDGQLFFLGLGHALIADTLTITGTGSSLVIAAGEQIEVTETGILQSNAFLNGDVELSLKNSFTGRLEGSPPNATYDMAVHSFPIIQDEFTGLRIRNSRNPRVYSDSIVSEELHFENTVIIDSVSRSFTIRDLVSIDSQSSLRGIATDLSFSGDDPRIVNEGSDTVVVKSLRVDLALGDLHMNSPIRSSVVHLNNGRIILEGGPMRSDVFLNPSIRSYIVTSRDNYLETTVMSESHIIPVGGADYYAPASVRQGFQNAPGTIRIYVEPLGVTSTDTVNVVWNIASKISEAVIYSIDFAWHPANGENIGNLMDTVSVFIPSANRVRASFSTGDSTGVSSFMTPLPVSFAVRKAVRPEIVKPRALSVFPNPCKDVLYIFHSTQGQQTINVLNANGQRIGLESETVALGEILNTSFLPPGLYILEVVDEGERRFVKFIKH